MRSRRGTPVLTQGFACYSIYECADGRRLTVGALEPKFFARLCELLERPELAAAQYDADQPALQAASWRDVFARRPLEHWLRLFEAEDVCVGPVATLAEAAADLGVPAHGRAPAAGAHTADWRRELGL